MKTSQTTRLALVLGGIVVLAYLVTQYSGKLSEGLEVVTGPLSDAGPYAPSTHSVGGNAQPTEAIQGRTPSRQGSYTQHTLGAGELLPGGELGASWAAVNPAGLVDLKGQNFLDTGFHSNTAVAGVSQTNRNASYDVRSEDQNPQTSVGPWLNSTIESSPFRRGLPT
jgi:hypothetical protein